MNYGQIIDRISSNLGDPRQGFDRAIALVDLEEWMEVDLPNVVSGIFRDGYTTMSVGGGGVPSPNNGEYSIPSNIRTIKEPMFVDDERLRIYTDPEEFYNEHPKDISVASQGQPDVVLVYGTKLTFRPIPPSSTTYTITVYGTLYPVYTMTEGTTVPFRQLEGVLIAVGTVLYAARLKNQLAYQVWSPITEARIASLKRASFGGVKHMSPKELNF